MKDEAGHVFQGQLFALVTPVNPFNNPYYNPRYIITKCRKDKAEELQPKLDAIIASISPIPEVGAAGE